MSYETQNQIKRLNFDEINDTWNKKYEWGGDQKMKDLMGASKKIRIPKNLKRR